MCVLAGGGKRKKANDAEANKASSSLSRSAFELAKSMLGVSCCASFPPFCLATTLRTGKSNKHYGGKNAGKGKSHGKGKKGYGKGKGIAALALSQKGPCCSRSLLM